MYYQSQRSVSEKVVHLEALLSYSDIIADAVSLASLRSKDELIIIAEHAQENLKDVARADGPVIVRSVYESVPIVGQAPGEKLKEQITQLDQSLVPQLEAQLEMNLALMYTFLIHLREYDSLIEKRGELVGSAGRKFDPANMKVRMQLCQRLGAIRYMDASAISLGPGLEQELPKHFQDGASMFEGAQRLAFDYTAYDQFLATFNRGRLEFLQGKDKGLTREYLQHAYQLQRQIQNKSFEALTEHYLEAIDSKHGEVIDDPPEYRMTLREIASSKPRYSSLVLTG